MADFRTFVPVRVLLKGLPHATLGPLLRLISPVEGPGDPNGIRTGVTGVKSGASIVQVPVYKRVMMNENFCSQTMKVEAIGEIRVQLIRSER
jgi:hypothetical protein